MSEREPGVLFADCEVCGEAMPERIHLRDAQMDLVCEVCGWRCLVFVCPDCRDYPGDGGHVCRTCDKPGKKVEPGHDGADWL